MATQRDERAELDRLSIFFNHHIWANQRVISACLPMSSEQLAHSDPGTYGSIRSTLRHLVDSEERYVKHLTGRPRALPPVEDETPLAEMLQRSRRSGEALREIAGSIEPGTICQVGDGDQVELIPAEVILLQAIEHGHEHRTHILTLRGQLGLEPCPVDGWDYYELVLSPRDKE